jgi:hypothetical protein
MLKVCVMCLALAAASTPTPGFTVIAGTVVTALQVSFFRINILGTSVSPCDYYRYPKEKKRETVFSIRSTCWLALIASLRNGVDRTGATYPRPAHAQV